MAEEKNESKNLFLFFVITFLWSWLFWLPEILWNVHLFFGSFGPLVSALILTYKNEGKTGVVSLFKRAFNFKFKKIWLIPTFLIFPFIMFVSYVLSSLIEGKGVDFSYFAQSNLFSLIFIFVYILFLGGPVAEEFGWRGYALDRLQKRWNALVSSLILGVMWGLWHIPLFFMKGSIQSLIPFWAFLVLIVSGSIIFTWIYNNTEGSLFTALMLHTMNNLSFVLFPILGLKLGGPMLLLISVVTSIVVVIIFGPKRLSRKI